ncbi:hypothetical protein [Salinibacillus xinjiangensis]|uniref:Uncharacterized protein n=1 Tax=Salinibacillus xinjiangensis TaxID=1229268 RepID=A0A6G1X7V7_9BACI|nr:hypothetical protein [Salinibacillus xinjiangensis]MRG87022.1 hypothetical protein [Salinibacillus xinjiangensis]
MNKEINFMFNTHKIYKNSFLNEINNKVDHIIVNNNNVLVYKKGSLEIMIDKSGSVYITGDVEGEDNLNVFILAALDEYSDLSKMDNRFEVKYPFKIITPKDITNSVKNSLKRLNYTYTFNEMVNDDSFYVYSN